MEHWSTGTFLVAFALAACNGAKPAPTAGAGFRTLPSDQVIVGFEQYVTEAGAKRAIMVGDTAFIFEDSTLAKVHNANLTMFDDKGAVMARLTSKTGDVNSATQAMVARGNVVLVTTDAGTIETEELHYEPQSHRLWSNVHTVQHLKNGGTMTGSGFTADDKFQNVQVTNASSRGGALKIQF